MRILTYLFRQSWRKLVLVMVASTAAGLSGAALVAMIGKAIGGAGFPHMAWAYFAVCAVMMLARVTAETTMVRVTQENILQLRAGLSLKMLSTPVKHLQELGKSGMLVILTHDLDNFVAALPVMPLSICNVLIVLSCLGYVAWLSPTLFLFIAVILTVSVSAFQYGRRFPQRHLLAVRGHIDTLHRQFRNLIDGSRELQLNAERGRRYVATELQPAAALYRDSFVRYVGGFSWLTNAGNMIFFVFVGMILFLVQGWLRLSPDLLATSVMAMMYMMRPIMELVNSVPQLQNADIALARIERIDSDLSLFARPAPLDAPDPFVSDGPLRLQLHDVRHQYGNEREAHSFMLGPLNLTIGQGEIVFLVGGNGSGKTTLAMLLLGLYEPEHGYVSLNGVPVDADNIGAYRRRFSAIFADFHLFDALLNSDPERSDADANRYLAALEIDHKVRVERGRFTTVNLSTGQRKRLALVSSYLDDREVYLFDEWAADQDPAFKRVFYTKLLPELKARGKTVIAITHDDQYFDCADRVIKLADGHIETTRGRADSAPDLHFA